MKNGGNRQGEVDHDYTEVDDPGDFQSALSRMARQDREVFTAWVEGRPGVPFVDANMRELNETGYMSNRGRHNVASFLAKYLKIDRRWGAACFESRLIDYDVCSNRGNWTNNAGVGNDPRDRIFKVVSQARRYDPNSDYTRHWLPELADVPTEALHTANGVSESGLIYPAAIVSISRVPSEYRKQTASASLCRNELYVEIRKIGLKLLAHMFAYSAERSAAHSPPGFKPNRLN